MVGAVAPYPCPWHRPTQCRRLVATAAVPQLGWGSRLTKELEAPSVASNLQAVLGRGLESASAHGGSTDPLLLLLTSSPTAP